MKKDKLAKLALMGLTAGVLASNGVEAFHNKPNTQGLIASGCGGKKGCGNIASSCNSKKGCGNVAAGCGGKNGCNSVASGCGGKNGCNSVASGCEGHGCNAIADKCGSKCSHVADNYAPHSCSSAIAENDTKKPLTSPAPIPKASQDSKGDQKKSDTSSDPNDQNIGYHVLTDDELTLELNDDTLKVYQQMTPEAKALTRLVASARCNGTNECSGLNACKTETNSCAGKGSCKGTGKCAFSDKNLAVRVVAEKMKTKRQELTK